MKNDLISRQAAISEIMEDIEDRSLHDDPATPEDYAEGYDEGIRNAAAIVLQMPSAQPGWIPVTKRLPKPKEYVNGVRKYYLVQNEYGDMMVCSWDGRCWMQMYHHTNVEDKVVAWMPLPKTWEREQENGSD